MAKKKLSHEDIVAMLKRKQGDKSLRQFAKEFGVSAMYLSDVYHSRRSAGPAVLERLGIERVVERTAYYVQQSA